jgi:hypothetical protein
VENLMGIPIELPGWVQLVAWLIVVLMVIRIAVAVYSTILRSKDRTLIEEIHAKSNLTMLTLRSWQENPQTHDGEPDPTQNYVYDESAKNPWEGRQQPSLYPQRDVELTTPQERIYPN